MTQLEESAKNVRNRLLFMLNIWSSKELQFRLPYPTIEFFLMWVDLYHPDGDTFNLSFNNHEKPHIIKFGEQLSKILKTYDEYPPILEELVKTKEWRQLNKLAIKTLEEINKNAT